MRVLVACEFSGTVRDAFIKRGHDAVSCDLLPAKNGGPHIQGDVLNVLDKMGFDLMIAHPPCTYISQMSYCRSKEPGRAELAKEGFEFAMKLFNAPVPKIAMENPRGRIEQWFRPADQIIQPYEYGHPETKATCLWLKGLPLLKPTTPDNKPAPKRLQVRADGSTRLRGFVDNATGRNGMTRQQVRQMTFQGIANAMADQWGKP